MLQKIMEKSEAKLSVKHKLHSCMLDEEGIKTLVKKIDDKIIFEEVRETDYVRSYFKVSSKIQINSTEYEAESSKIDDFFSLDVIPPVLTNLSMRWHNKCRDRKEKKEIERSITLLFSKKGASVSISGESYDWINSVFSMIDLVAKNNRNNNDKKVWLYGVIFWLFPLIIYYLYLKIGVYESWTGLFALIWFFVGLVLLSEKVPSLFPHVTITVKSTEGEFSFLEKMLGNVILAILTTILGFFILKYFGLV